MGRGNARLAETAAEQCEAITILTDWKRRQKVKDLRCQYFAKLKVGEKRLCYRHALLETLAISIMDGKVEILPNPAFHPRYAPVPTIADADKCAECGRAQGQHFTSCSGYVKEAAR